MGFQIFKKSATQPGLKKEPEVSPGQRAKMIRPSEDIEFRATRGSAEAGLEYGLRSGVVDLRLKERVCLKKIIEHGPSYARGCRISEW